MVLSRGRSQRNHHPGISEHFFGKIVFLGDCFVFQTAVVVRWQLVLEPIQWDRHIIQGAGLCGSPSPSTRPLKKVLFFLLQESNYSEGCFGFILRPGPSLLIPRTRGGEMYFPVCFTVRKRILCANKHEDTGSKWYSMWCLAP